MGRIVYLIVLVLFVILFSATLSAEELADPLSWIGLSPAEALERFGAPESVYPLRGARATEDSVVFYREGFYLYFYQDRLWQLRIDRSSLLSLDEITIGMPRKEVIGRLGEPLHRDSGGEYWELQRETYPVRLRLHFDSEGAVEDIYLFRGDY